jgi:hypothetical protein
MNQARNPHLPGSPLPGDTPWSGSGYRNLIPIYLSAMSAQPSTARRGRGGRPSKGPRRQFTLRCDEPLANRIERAAADAEMETNAYLVELLRLATEAGLVPASAQERLPLSA